MRVYTRDSGDWMALGWEAQALFVLALRKCDRAGFLSIGRAGHRGLAALVGMPADVVERALPILLADGCVVTGSEPGQLVVPNFIEAQETPQTDAQRSRERRARERDRAITKRDAGITGRVANVTTAHEDARPSTPFRSDPCFLSVPGSVPLSVSDPRANSGPKMAYDWLEFFKPRWCAKAGRLTYGQGEADAKAMGRLDDLLASLENADREADWEARERIVEEFLRSSDQRTIEAGHSFAFFAARFNGLRVPQSTRSAPQGKPAPYRWPDAPVPR